MISLHTSPLERPGTGDAGGLNVYVVETATRLARRGVEVDIFTRATGRGQQRVELEPGLDVTVHHVPAGPLEGVPKDELPGHLCAFADDLSRHVAGLSEGHYDLIHAHYWLSGQASGLTARRFDVPLVQTMHTMARVKNAALAAGDPPEPEARVTGEQDLVDAADALVANTPAEARDLVELYAAAPERVHIVPPGVALETFRPGDRAADRRAAGLAPDAVVLLFVGRIQPLKGPDVLVRAAGELVRRAPELRERLVVSVLGGLSGSGLAKPEALQRLAEEEGVADLVSFGPPVSREELASRMRAADLVVVPSYNESFGLVAIEALACGTPVVAARVGVSRWRSARPVSWSTGTAPRTGRVRSRVRWTGSRGRGSGPPGRRRRWSTPSATRGSTRWMRCSRPMLRPGRCVEEGTMDEAEVGREAGAALRAHLDALGVDWEDGTRPGEAVVSLPGERKLRTVVSLVVGTRALELRAFVIRNPDENHEAVYRYLLRRTLRLPGVAYAVDRSGDVYLTGRVPLAGLDEQVLDELWARCWRPATSRSTSC